MSSVLGSGLKGPSRVAAALVAGALLASVSARAAEPAEEGPVGEPQDEMMRYPPSSVRFPLIAGGVGVLGLAYGLGAMCAGLWPEVPGAEPWLYIPIIGPWAALAKSGCAEDDPDCSAIIYIRGVLYVLSGIAQIGGAGLIGEGIFMTTEAEGAAPKASWTIVPTGGPNQAGIAAVGTF